ncbi:MAG: two-component regulator propeller domain-containing protein [Bacteroidota bacterium]
MRTFMLFVTVQMMCLFSYPQQYSFSGYSIEQGLSQSVVNCMIQDANGFIWVGTQHGLNRFNGYTFDTYTFNPSDTNSISNNWVYSLVEDKKDNLIVLTKGGVNIYDRYKKSFSRFSIPGSDDKPVNTYPYDVILSKTGLVCFNMAPVLLVYDPLKKSFKRYPSKLDYDGSVKDLKIPMIEDASGQIWMGSTKGLSCFDPRTSRFTYFLHDPSNRNSISNNNITALFEDNNGNIWVGTPEGLNVIEKKTQSITRFVHDPRDRWSLSNNVIRAILQDRNMNVWIGTEGGGLNKLRMSSAEKPVFEIFNSELNALSHNIVNALLVDRSEILWIGTLSGLCKTDLKKQKFRLYRLSNTPYSVDLLGNVIASIFKDDQGRIWVGNWGQGLNILDRKTGKVEHFSSRLTGNRHLDNDFVHYIFQDNQKRIWLGTRDGLMVWKPESNSFIPARVCFKGSAVPDLRGTRVNKIMQDSSRNYWLATQNGVYRFNLSEGSPEHFSAEAAADHKLSGNLVYCIETDQQGLIWIATLNGLDVYDRGRKKMRHFRKISGSEKSISDNFVISLCVDHNGDVWIGTGSGVNKFLKKDSTFRYFTQQSGLPNEQVFEILEDNQHDLWFATGNGLSRFHPATSAFRTFTVEEGLQSLEFNLRAAFKAADGEMFFGGMNGFNSFYPDSLKDNSYIPAMFITSLTKTNGSGVNTKISPDNLRDIKLDYDDQQFTIEFVALEFTKPEKNRYSYKMEGISDQWIDIGNRRFVPFSNLPPGEYTFIVKGANNDGVWNETGRKLKISIKPPWFRSTIAYIVYLIDLLLIVFFFVRWRVKRLIMEKTLLEGKVLERTRQIETQKDKLEKSQEQLDTINKELEKRVESRTAEYLQAKEKAESGDRLKTAFMHNISREIRTPLNGVLGFGQMMLDDDCSSEDKKKYFEILQRSSDRLLNTITDYMDISLIVTGSMEVNSKLFDPAGIMDLIYRKYEQDARHKDLAFSLVVPLEARKKLFYSDPELLGNVLGHLLDNAIKFTNKGTVEFGFAIREEELQFFVKDTGCGIAEDDQDLIFDHFVQSGLQDNAVHEGSGLGLSIAKGILQILGGRIWLRSIPGEGSSIFFTIPGELSEP